MNSNCMLHYTYSYVCFNALTLRNFLLYVSCTNVSYILLHSFTYSFHQQFFVLLHVRKILIKKKKYADNVKTKALILLCKK